MRLALLSLSLLPLVAFADDPTDLGDRIESAAPARPEPSRAESARAHFEFVVGFAGGERDYRTAGFSFASGADNAPTFGKSLVSTFEQFPFARVRLIGPAWELRQVVDHVRFTVGLQKPFASFLLSDAQSTAAGGSSVITRSLSVWELRFGLGTEYRFGPVTPFIDLSGQLEWLGAELTVNDGQVSYKAQTFSLMGRAGARIQLSPLVFIAPSAEIGVLGNVRWGAQLMVGVTLPYD